MSLIVLWNIVWWYQCKFIIVSVAHILFSHLKTRHTTVLCANSVYWPGLRLAFRTTDRHSMSGWTRVVYTKLFIK